MYEEKNLQTEYKRPCNSFCRTILFVYVFVPFLYCFKYHKTHLSPERLKICSENKDTLTSPDPTGIF